MKKLMIIAAVAAMVGSVEAAGYQFSATLKTTKAKKGSVTSTQTYNMGIETNSLGTAAADYWYNSAEAARVFKACGSKIVIKDGAAHPEFDLKNGFLVTTNGEYVTELTTYTDTGATIASDLTELVTKYAQQTFDSAGRRVWCGSVKIKISPKCYRVAGSAKLAYNFYSNNCCNVSYNPFYENTDYRIGSNAGKLSQGSFFLQQFGAQSPDKANRAEIYEQVKFGPLANQTSLTTFIGYLAGQGTMGSYNDGSGVVSVVSSLSGNIVGYLDAPSCWYCCSTPDTAIAFDCVAAPAGSTALKTAAFGTFRIKFNKNLR